MRTLIRVRRDFNLISDTSANFASPVNNDSVILPASMGKVLLKGYSFPLDMNIYVGRYLLETPWELETLNELDTGAFCIFTSIMSNKIMLKMKNEWTAIDHKSPKGLFFYSPGTCVEVNYPKNEAFKTLAVTFTCDTIKAISDVPEIIEGLTPLSPFIYFDETVPAAQELIDKLATVCDEDSIPKFEIYLTLLKFVRLTLDRIFISKEHYNLTGLLKEDIDKIFAVKNKLTENPQHTPKISDIAREAGLGQSKMLKLFKQVFDRTIYQFAQNAKIIKAKDLLSTKKFNVSEVGFMVGYTNMTHFGKAFKKYYKVNPSDYLKQVLRTNRE